MRRDSAAWFLYELRSGTWTAAKYIAAGLKPDPDDLELRIIAASDSETEAAKQSWCC